MRKWWRNEQGSAMILVMIAGVVATLLFAGLYAVVHEGHVQAVAHRMQVQAQFDAEQNMEVALYYFYNDAGTFSTLYPATNTCHPGSKGGQVCYYVSKDADGNILKQSLTATGVESQSGASTQKSTISYDLTVAGSGGSTGGGGTGGGGTGGTGGGTGGSTPSEPYPGEEACSGNPFLIRAVVLNGDFDAGKAMLDTERRTLTNYPYSVEIYGGVYLDSNGRLIVSRQKNNAKFDRSVSINGWLRPEGGLDWSQGNGHQNELTYGIMGPYAKQDSCTRTADFHATLGALVTSVDNKLQPVDVYEFTGNPVTATTTGKKKDKNKSTLYNNDNETLSDVLRKAGDKIVIVKGTLRLDQALSSSGYLIVYNASGLSDIYLADHENWTHKGAVITEQIGHYAYDSKGKNPGYVYQNNAWPDSYRLYVTLTQAQADLYNQNTK